ncbi:Hypothetical_protein [Hexamita inflata]|uniref:Hypothetical_protein n=1 Tax=Hexamita inflata TaxID=28002 RepID=A0AA86P1T0_9EUKA|nr:Hypothetical protein HINF_LOCUS18702 [Hexamita inflata]
MSDKSSSKNNSSSVSSSFKSTVSQSLFERKGLDYVTMPMKKILWQHYVLLAISTIFTQLARAMFYNFIQHKLWEETYSIIAVQPFIDFITIVYAQGIISASRGNLMSLLQNKQKNAAKAYFGCVLVIFYLTGLAVALSFGYFAKQISALFTNNEYVHYYVAIQVYGGLVGRSAFCFYREIMLIESRHHAALFMDIIHGAGLILLISLLVFFVDADVIANPNYYLIFGLVELFSYTIATLYPIYSLIAHFSQPKKGQIQDIMNQNPLKLKLANFIPFRLKLTLQTGSMSVPHIIRHACEPFLCCGIISLYNSYWEKVPIFARSGIIGCEMTRFYAKVVSSFSVQAESQLRPLFSINVKTDNITRVREFLFKGCSIICLLTFITGAAMAAFIPGLVAYKFQLNDQFMISRASFARHAGLWTLQVPYRFVLPLIEFSKFKHVELVQSICNWILVVGSLTAGCLTKKRVEFNVYMIQLMLFDAFIGALLYIAYLKKYTKQLTQKKIDPETIEEMEAKKNGKKHKEEKIYVAQLQQLEKVKPHSEFSDFLERKDV